MARQQVFNSKALLKTLDSFIRYATCCKTFRVSGIKRDGTVFVRFTSSLDHPAIFLAESFRDALNARGFEFTQTDDCKFRLMLEQFR